MSGTVAHQQGRYPVDLAEMVAWISAFTPPAGRVLEIGCGDGALVDALAAAGLDVHGIDPHATPARYVSAATLEDFDAAPFDVLFASVSLHHLPDPGRVSSALRRLSRPGTAMLVREFDRVALDHEPTLRWWYHQRRARDAVDPDPDELHLPDSFEGFVDRWRETMEHHVLPWPLVLDALEQAGFHAEASWTSAYLFRWGLSEPVRVVEEALIAEGRLREVGIRWVGRRG